MSFDANESFEEQDSEHCYPSEPLYTDSPICYAHFKYSFLSFCQASHLPECHRDSLIVLLKTLLPLNNKIPNLYNLLMKEERDLLKSTQMAICRICASQSGSNNECTDPRCKKYQKIDNSDSVNVISYDLVGQLKSIIIKNQDLIDKYGGYYFDYKRRFCLLNYYFFRDS